ncbi:uncharacterized protein DS421_3g84400 [Arachis hypogaea]|nr:uncharacterized protein DS421_3g84400 [Arachis hypogaea]
MTKGADATRAAAEGARATRAAAAAAKRCSCDGEKKQLFNGEREKLVRFVWSVNGAAGSELKRNVKRRTVAPPARRAEEHSFILQNKKERGRNSCDGALTCVGCGRVDGAREDRVELGLSECFLRKILNYTRIFYQ